MPQVASTPTPGRLNPFAAFFVFMSGVRVREAAEHNDVRHYANLGALMTFMFGWYSVAMGHALGIALGHTELKYEIGLGLAWAAFLTLFDRIIVSQPLMSDSFLYRLFAVFLGRAILGVAGALVTSLAAMMFLFHHDIQVQQAQDRQHASIRIVGPIGKSPDVVQARAQLKADNKQMTGLANAVTKWTNQVASDAKQVACERAGTCGTKVPDSPGKIGWQTQRDLNKQDADQRALNTAIATQKSQTPVLAHDASKQTATINAAYTQGANVLHNDHGLAAQWQALRELLAANWTMWLWLLVVICADLSVVGLKSMLRPTNLDLAHRAATVHAADLEAQWLKSPQRQTLIGMQLDRRADLENLRDEAAYEAELDRLSGQRLGGTAAGNTAGEPASGARTRSPRARRLGLVGAGLVTVGAVAAVAVSGSSSHSQTANGSPTSPTTPSSTSSPVTPMRAAARFVHYPLPPVTMAAARTMRAYLNSAGAPVMRLHRSTARFLAQPTTSSCTAVASTLTAPEKTETAAAGAPDPTLSQLAIDELHAAASVPGCKGVGPQGDLQALANVDTLLTRRLTQFGVNS